MHTQVLVQGYGWDLPNQIFGDTGQRYMGCNYYQNMILWAMPAALAGKDLTGPCKKGGLVDCIIKAGKVE